jgi:exosortase/archaeosortase
MIPRPKFTLVETEQILENNKELLIQSPKMNALLFESDIVPVQYVNNQLKNVLKIINYGTEMLPYTSKDYYQKVIKSFINTINITITSYSNLILPEEVLLKDYIYIN